MLAALGFKLHTGWGTFVAVVVEPDGMKVLTRGRMTLLPADRVLPRFVYHKAAELGAAPGAKLVERAERVALQNARNELSGILETVRDRGASVRACGVIGSTEIREETLAAILRSHPLIHAAEGRLFQDVVAAACRSVPLPVSVIREPDAWPAAATAYRCDEAALRAQIDALRKSVGPPWAADEKIAAAAAVAADLRQSLSSESRSISFT
jgi:hypothetical protein